MTFAHYKPSLCQISALPLHPSSPAAGQCCSPVVQQQNPQLHSGDGWSDTDVSRLGDSAGLSYADTPPSQHGSAGLQKKRMGWGLHQPWARLLVSLQGPVQNPKPLDRHFVASIGARWGHPQGLPWRLVFACMLINSLETAARGESTEEQPAKAVKLNRGAARGHLKALTAAV